ncbi:dethiobiotin synthase [Arthrobacter sp. 35W]|uniref:dethiobiotin synthase n=1 Tax=Arthrobacter sp. 35W TaxID=1132441 RepID=UPI00040FCC1D
MPRALVGAPRVLLVTGTDTDVGKTIATAALAAALTAGGRSVAVYKPVQTGVSGDAPGDAAEVRRLAGTGGVHEGIRLTEPMAPVPAAVVDGAELPSLEQHVQRVHGLAEAHDHVLVEGAGGLLVELDGAGNTLAELAGALAPDAAVVLVARSALGTLNHVALTLEALERRGLPVLGLVIGSWPEAPDAVELSNREHFAALDTPLLAAIPAGAAALPPKVFRKRSAGWFGAPPDPPRRTRPLLATQFPSEDAVVVMSRKGNRVMGAGVQF